MKGLTRRQQDVLGYIEDYVRSHGYPPSVREIASHFSLVSASGVHKHIKALVRKNFLAKQDFTSRSIRVLRRTGAVKSQSVDANRWPYYGVLTAQGIRPRTTSVPSDWRPSDPNVSTGGIVVVVESGEFGAQNVQGGDVLFISAQVTPRGGDLLLLESDGRADLIRANSSATTGYRGLRGVVVGMWRPLSSAQRT